MEVAGFTVEMTCDILFRAKPADLTTFSRLNVSFMMTMFKCEFVMNYVTGCNVDRR